MLEQSIKKVTFLEFVEVYPMTLILHYWHAIPKFSIEDVCTVEGYIGQA